MASHNELGKWGEELARVYLRQKGYVILECDWKSGHRDLDIIALDGDVVVFVEVRTRRNRVFAEPEESIDYMKLRNLQSAINHYVKCKHIDHQIRFDFISIVGVPDGGDPEIRHIEDVPMC